MSLTESNYSLQTGAKAPNFTLPSTNQYGGLSQITLFDTTEIITAENKSDSLPIRGYLIAFICNHCPFVIHLADTFSKLSAKYSEQGIQTIAISSNDVSTHPQDDPGKMKEEAILRNYQFPYLYDKSQEVAKSFGAACTPDFFVLTEDFQLYYHGQFDDSRPSLKLPVTGADVSQALDNLLARKNHHTAKPSIGCNIKWIQGNEPEYFLNK